MRARPSSPPAPGSRQLLPDMPAPLRVTRQVMGWFQPLDPAPFTGGRFPVFLLESRHGVHYGFPPFASGAVKVARHHHADETVDPDRFDRAVSAADEALIRAALADHIPAANGPLAAAKTCLYTVTPDRDFLIDRLPGAREYHRRLALLRPRLQIRPGGRRNPGRSGDRRRHRPRHQPLPIWPVRLIVSDPAIVGPKASGGNAMQGLMQDWPLLCHRIIDHAAIQHARSRRSSRARSKGRSTRPTMPRSAAARSRWRSGSRRTASSSATASPRWPGTPGGIWKPGTASSASARSTTPSIRGCFPTRSSGSSIMPRTA